MGAKPPPLFQNARMDLPDLEKLEKRAYTRKELQRFAKALEIRANRRNEDLVADLREALTRKASIASTCPPGPAPATPSLTETKRRELLGALVQSGPGASGAPEAPVTPVQGESTAQESQTSALPLPTSPDAGCSEIFMTVPVEGGVAESKVLTPTAEIQRAREAQRDRSHLAQSTLGEERVTGEEELGDLAVCAGPQSENALSAEQPRDTAQVGQPQTRELAEEAVLGPHDENVSLTLTRTTEPTGGRADADGEARAAEAVPSLLIHSVPSASAAPERGAQGGSSPDSSGLQGTSTSVGPQYISLTATLGLASSQDGMPSFIAASPDNRELYAAQLKRMIVCACTSVKRRLRRCFDERSRQFLRLASAECVELPASIRNARLDQLSKISGTLSNRSATEGLARTTATLRGIRNAEKAAKEAIERSQMKKE